MKTLIRTHIEKKKDTILRRFELLTSRAVGRRANHCTTEPMYIGVTIESSSKLMNHLSGDNKRRRNCDHPWLQ